VAGNGWRDDQSPAGRKKTGPSPTDRGKGCVKRSLLTEAHGTPTAIVVDAANRHDMKLLCSTIEDLQLDRPVPNGACSTVGRPAYAQLYEPVPRPAHTLAEEGVPLPLHFSIWYAAALSTAKPAHRIGSKKHPFQGRSALIRNGHV
jgi:hypothetical protein